MNPVMPNLLVRAARRRRAASLSAIAALALGLAACSLDPEQGAPVSLTGTGSIDGQLFFDANNSGTFDPLGGDTVLAGVQVRLTQRGDTLPSGVIATATTDAQGRFAFAGVPIGTHELRVPSASPRQCAPLAVTIGTGEAAYATTGLRLTCRIDIAVARASTSGQLYTVEGVVTVAPGAFQSGTGGVNSELWVQDATGGIAVFSYPTANPAGIQLGDRVEVTGTLGAFSGQLQLQNNPQVIRKASGTPITPRIVTGAQLVARTYEGTLVTLESFRPTAINTPSAAGAFTVTGTAAGGQTVAVRVSGANTGLAPANFVIGTAYSVTGVATINSGNVQIKPRNRADVTP